MTQGETWTPCDGTGRMPHATCRAHRTVRRRRRCARVARGTQEGVAATVTALREVAMKTSPGPT